MDNFHTFPARTPSPRSMLSCDKRLQPETWNPPGPQEIFFANPRPTLESLQIPYQGTHPLMAPNAAAGLPRLSAQGDLWQEREERVGCTIPMPTSARRPPTWRSFILVDIPHSSMVGQQRQQISELQIDIFLTPQSFLSWKMRFRNQVTTCSDFSRRLCYGSKRWRWWIQWQVRICQILRCWTRALLLLRTRSSRITTSKKKVSLEEQKAPERGSVSSRKTDRLHDLRLL